MLPVGLKQLGESPTLLDDYEVLRGSDVGHVEPSRALPFLDFLVTMNEAYTPTILAKVTVLFHAFIRAEALFTRSPFLHMPLQTLS